MGPVAQAVFLADYTEPGRIGESFDRIRRALPKEGDKEISLDDAIVTACEETLKYLREGGQTPAGDTEATMRSFKKCREERK